VIASALPPPFENGEKKEEEKMKAWKMAGCLLLLVVIICGCAVLGQTVEASAAETPTEQEGGGTSTDLSTPPAENEPQPPTGGSVTVEKIYSKGLYFRSNGDGTCALAGIGSCTAASVLIPPQSPAGDTVTEILPGAFVGSIVGAIEIPTTVTALSAGSFTGCARLAYIRVAAGNPAFSEYGGALYSADGKKLIYCPAGYSGAELTLSPALSRIAAGAFAECTALQAVVFEGTMAEWHSLTVGDENEPLYAATLRFTGT
jgi:hypothetical protein